MSYDIAKMSKKRLNSETKETRYETVRKIKITNMTKEVFANYSVAVLAFKFYITCVSFTQCRAN
jgi:spermidine/putrescine-binding protein